MLSGYWRIDADVIASYGSSDFEPIYSANRRLMRSVGGL